jgi:NAD(P)-dependent dehydrogenase (short-subunit alcohol dehydrogenase family)
MIGDAQMVGGRPQKPTGHEKVLDVNLKGVMYSKRFLFGSISSHSHGDLPATHLALHYMQQTLSPGALKSLVLMSSMAGLHTLYGFGDYSAAKHGTVGLMRSLAVPYQKRGIKIATVNPWYVGACGPYSACCVGS